MSLTDFKAKMNKSKINKYKINNNNKTNTKHVLEEGGGGIREGQIIQFFPQT
jgi:hypothetical protein